MARANSYLCGAYGGATSLCPPGHTLESIRKAIEVGASMVYVEVRTVRHGDMVAWPSLQRLVDNEPVHLSDYMLAEWAEITEYDTAPILPIDDLLALVKSTRCGIALEIRNNGIEHALARKLRDWDIASETVMVVSSESSRPLMHSMSPNIPVGHRFHLDEQAKITNKLIDGLGVDAVVWPASVLTPGLVKMLKNRGITVYAGLVNLAEEMRRLRDECGVDGIVTPYPDLLIDLPVRRHGNFRIAA